MHITLAQILTWLSHYGYFVIFPLAIIEGPIITIIAGFLCSLGQLDLRLAYLVVVAGDISGDCLYYALGRFAQDRSPKRLLRLLGLTPERIELVRGYFARHPKKTFTIAKISHGIGAAPLFAAGLVRYPFAKFFLYNLLLTFVKSIILILIGFYFGQTYVHIKTYLDYAAIVGVVAFIGLYWAFIHYTKSPLEK
jgi:membrane-associated protein